MAAVAARQGKHVEALAATLKQAPSMVYCLESLSRVGSTATYIGFTVSPYRRLRQHNGEVTAGARRTRKRQPWSFVAVVRGFVSQTVGLQFEWAWQHPDRSVHFREVRRQFPRSRRGALARLRELHFLLKCAPWCHMQLTVAIMHERHVKAFADLPGGPPPATVLHATPELLQSWSGSEAVPDILGSWAAGGCLPTATSGSERSGSSAGSVTDADEAEDEASSMGEMEAAVEGAVVPSTQPRVCCVCGEMGRPTWQCPQCEATAHWLCLARHSLTGTPTTVLIPSSFQCPACHSAGEWAAAAAAYRTEWLAAAACSGSPGDEAQALEAASDEVPIHEPE